jgi:Ferritin-like domain
MVDEAGGDQASLRCTGAARSRRAFLTGAGTATAAGLLAGCGGKPLREKIRGSAKVAASDIEPLNALLDVEHRAIAAYAAGIPLLSAPQSTAAMRFLGQELAHSVQLSDLIHRGGGKPRRPAASYDLGHPTKAGEALALLKHLEQVQLRAYLDAFVRLSPGKVRSTVAAIYANDAQHLAMLRWQTGESPAPAALVSGS